MATKRDYYEVLGIHRTATDVEIKRAFRNQARQYHPDVNKSHDAESRFKEISEAYEILGDGRKRAAYDRFGHAGQPGVEGFGDIGGFADIFETFFGGGRRGGHRGPQRGTDMRIDMRLSFTEAVFGAEREIEIPVLQTCKACQGSGAEPGSSATPCPRCQGSGEMRRVQQSVFGQFVNVVMCEACQGEGQIVASQCRVCRGQGRVREPKQILVSVPAGVDRGQQIRLTGEGETGPKGGPPGDLYIVLDIEEHSLFKREGYDITYELPLNVAQAALGTDVTIPTLDGEVELHVPAGTQSGRTFSFRGKGVPHLRSSQRGALFVEARVVTPTKMNGRQRELFEELSRELNGQSEEEKGFFDKVKEAFGA